MAEPRKHRRVGPLLWQIKLRMKRLDRILDAGFAKMLAVEAAIVAAEQARLTQGLLMREKAVTMALETARRALASHHNCLTTDRPDLPRSADTGWATDFSRELQLLDEAIDLTSMCPRSSGGSSGPLTGLLSAPAKRAVAPRSNRMPGKDCS